MEAPNNNYQSGPQILIRLSSLNDQLDDIKNTNRTASWWYLQTQGRRLSNEKNVIINSKLLSNRQFNILNNECNKLYLKIAHLFHREPFETTTSGQKNSVNAEMELATEDAHIAGEVLGKYLQRVWVEDFVVNGQLNFDVDMDKIYPRREFLLKMITSSPTLTAKDRNKFSRIISREFSVKTSTKEKVEAIASGILSDIMRVYGDKRIIAILAADITLTRNLLLSEFGGEASWVSEDAEELIEAEFLQKIP